MNYTKDTEQKMDKVIEILSDALKNIHTSRASTALVENIEVSAYGQNMAIKTMAQISIPEPTQIAIIPWNKDQLGAIETAIRESDLGVNPVNDGNAVRINLPPLNEERRLEVVKQVKKIAEEARVELRNLRHQAQDLLKKDIEADKATEDDKFKITKELDDLIGKYNGQIEDLTKRKESEIMTV